MGFCPQCKESTLAEEPERVSRVRAPGAVTPVTAVANHPRRDRRSTGFEEVDRVLGGGLSPGSAVLLGGEPGVGKSTLLLQIAASTAQAGPVLMVSAEESMQQVAMRARRVDAAVTNVVLCAESDVDAILATIDEVRPLLVVVDSVQTISSSDVTGSAGGVAQVRESGARLVTAAHRLGIPIVMVGHVNKEGHLAGPKVLEHVVDVVLLLEGDHDHGLRILRSTKNRHGSVDRVGVFEMTECGLVGVADPSSLLVGTWAGDVAGTALFPMVHGKRAVLVEVQALVVPSTAPQPRRSVKGVDAARVHQLLAVLERHGRIRFADHEVYVNVVGGLRVVEPAADFPLALALASARTRQPLGKIAAFGEVGLTAELRSVGRSGLRREEAHRLGIDDVIEPISGTGLVAVLRTLGLGSTKLHAAAIA